MTDAEFLASYQAAKVTTHENARGRWAYCIHAARIACWDPGYRFGSEAAARKAGEKDLAAVTRYYEARLAEHPLRRRVEVGPRMTGLAVFGWAWSTVLAALADASHRFHRWEGWPGTAFIDEAVRGAHEPITLDEALALAPTLHPTAAR